MDEEKKPRSRVKKVVNDGKEVEIHGEGLGTGPVNNMGSYADRKQQAAGRPSQQTPTQGRAQTQIPFGQNRPKAAA